MHETRPRPPSDGAGPADGVAHVFEDLACLRKDDLGVVGLSEMRIDLPQHVQCPREFPPRHALARDLDRVHRRLARLGVVTLMPAKERLRRERLCASRRAVAIHHRHRFEHSAFRRREVRGLPGVVEQVEEDRESGLDIGGIQFAQGVERKPDPAGLMSGRDRDAGGSGQKRGVVHPDSFGRIIHPGPDLEDPVKVYLGFRVCVGPLGHRHCRE